MRSRSSSGVTRTASPGASATPVPLRSPPAVTSPTVPSTIATPSRSSRCSCPGAATTCVSAKSGTSGANRDTPSRGAGRSTATGPGVGSSTLTSSPTSTCLGVKPPRSTLSLAAMISTPRPDWYACSTPAGTNSPSPRRRTTRFISRATPMPRSPGKSTASRRMRSSSAANSTDSASAAAATICAMTPAASPASSHSIVSRTAAAASAPESRTASTCPPAPSSDSSRRVSCRSRMPARAVKVSLTATMSSGLWFSSRYVRSGASRGIPSASSRAKASMACAREGCAWIESEDAAASSFMRYGSRSGAPVPAPSCASHSPSVRPSATCAGQPGWSPNHTSASGRPDGARPCRAAISVVEPQS